MKELSLADNAHTAESLYSETEEATMTGAIRVALATAMFASIYSVDVLSPGENLAALACFIYLVYAVLGMVLIRRWLHSALARRMVWMDVIWLSLLVGLTGGANGSFFLAFLFPVLAGSFSRGFEQGAQLTIVSAGLLAAAHLLLAGAELPRLLMRLAFLLSLGYLSAYWGEAKIQLKRRLELLRDVSQISNPRFGAQHTVQTFLSRICHFYGARRCVLLLAHSEGMTATVQKASHDKTRSRPRTVQRDAVAPLLELEPRKLTRYAPNPVVRWWSQAKHCDLETLCWKRSDSSAHTRIAALLGAENFISVPVKLHSESGHLFLIDVPDRVRRDDAEFLGQIVAQAFPAIETIELLDQLASQAASEERKRVALDLHDSAIQPYIGIRLGLNALRRKAESENPLTPDIDSLIGVTDEVIIELRHFASTVAERQAASRPLLIETLQRKIEQLQHLYGLDVVLEVRDITLSDRMMGQIIQIVYEGLSNICRHTLAQRGEVLIERIDDVLKIIIINDASEDPTEEFTPRSITARVHAMGGQVKVDVSDDRRTVVSVDIPF